MPAVLGWHSVETTATWLRRYRFASPSRQHHEAAASGQQPGQAGSDDRPRHTNRRDVAVIDAAHGRRVAGHVNIISAGPSIGGEISYTERNSLRIPRARNGAGRIDQGITA